jgi:hypothetical protein
MPGACVVNAIIPPVKARVPIDRKARQLTLLFMGDSRRSNENGDPRLSDAFRIELPRVPEDYDQNPVFS